MVPSARAGAPAVRMKLLTPMPTHWKMKPKQSIWMNMRAWGRTSSVALDAVSSQSRKAGLSPTAATTTAMTMLSMTTLPSAFSAASRLPAPSRKAANALPPLPTSMASAMNTIMMGLATVTTERPISPTALPKKMESMRL